MKSAANGPTRSASVGFFRANRPSKRPSGGGRPVERRDDRAVLVREAGTNVRLGHINDAADDEPVLELGITSE